MVELSAFGSECTPLRTDLDSIPLTVVLEGRQAIRKTFLHGRSGVAGMAQYPLSLDGLGGVATGETGCTDL